MFEGSPWRDNTLDSQSPNIQRCLCSYEELRSPQLVYSSLLSRNEDDSRPEDMVPTDGSHSFIHLLSEDVKTGAVDSTVLAPGAQWF